MNESPTPFEQLLEYAFGELSEQERESVNQLLTTQPDLRGVLSLLEETRAELSQGGLESAPAESIRRVKAMLARASSPAVLKQWLARIDAVVATLIFDSRSAEAQLGYRGDDATRLLSYESEQATVDLEITEQPSPSERHLQIRGQAKSIGEGLITGVHLLDSDGPQCVDSAIPDERGNFRFRCPAGRYDLAIEIDDGAGAMLLRDLGA